MPAAEQRKLSQLSVGKRAPGVQDGSACLAPSMWLSIALNACQHKQLLTSVTYILLQLSQVPLCSLHSPEGCIGAVAVPYHRVPTVSLAIAAPLAALPAAMRITLAGC
jgi:hypothetical protein